MGRGLSKLQQWMLVRALDGADRGEGGSGGCDLTLLRTLSEFYGVPLAEQLSERLSKRNNLIGVGKAFSNPGDVLRAKSHRPAIIRAMNRLEQRKLAERVSGAFARWSGIEITAAGRIEAERLKGTATNGIVPDRAAGDFRRTTP